LVGNLEIMEGRGGDWSHSGGKEESEKKLETTKAAGLELGN